MRFTLGNNTHFGNFFTRSWWYSWLCESQTANHSHQDTSVIMHRDGSRVFGKHFFCLKPFLREEAAVKSKNVHQLVRIDSIPYEHMHLSLVYLLCIFWKKSFSSSNAPKFRVQIRDSKSEKFANTSNFANISPPMNIKQEYAIISVHFFFVSFELPCVCDSLAAYSAFVHFWIGIGETPVTHWRSACLNDRNRAVPVESPSSLVGILLRRPGRID